MNQGPVDGVSYALIVVQVKISVLHVGRHRFCGLELAVAEIGWIGFLIGGLQLGVGIVTNLLPRLHLEPVKVNPFHQGIVARKVEL